MGVQTLRRVQPDTGVLRDYQELVARGATYQRSTEHSGPEHGNRGPELEEWADKVAHPRENMDELVAMGIHAESFSELRTAGSGGSY